MLTTFRIDGANCSICFNDAVDELKRTEGVFDVKGSMAGPCIDITHDDSVDADDLASIVRSHVHGVAMYANEIRMIPLEPFVTHCACGHA